jgi:hypothetical protein
MQSGTPSRHLHRHVRNFLSLRGDATGEFQEVAHDD